jgi:hypothetical protein
MSKSKIITTHLIFLQFQYEVKSETTFDYLSKHVKAQWEKSLYLSGSSGNVKHTLEHTFSMENHQLSYLNHFCPI